MKVAVVGSRGLHIEDLAAYLPTAITEIVTGGAKGIDSDAARYAQEHGLALTVIRPQYTRYKRGAPLMRNREIVAKADWVVAIWDGRSRGTAQVIDLCRQSGKPLTLIER